MHTVIGWWTMKNKSLSMQIWIVFASITLFIAIILAFIIPGTLRSFFTEETYTTLESAQNIVLRGYSLEDFDQREFNGSELEDIRMVKHIIIYDNDRIALNSPVSSEFLNEIKESIGQQEQGNKRYKFSLEDKDIFYTVNKAPAGSNYKFLVSYIGDSYRNDLVYTLFKKLIGVMILIFVLSWIPALLLAKYLSKPLVDLERKVEKLSARDWQEPMKIDRKDEIGKLGSSLEDLRTQLISQDKLERDFLQNISHDLKTPVMVIRSFLQAIKDGIFPKGDLDSSLDLMDEEAERLEKKIKDLLYFSKLEYLSYEKDKFEKFSLSRLLEDIASKFKFKDDIKFHLDIQDTVIVGDVERWTVVIENILDNATRYASDEIFITLHIENGKTRLQIGNDGPKIEQETFDNLFKEYNKGEKGEFGIGLAIVKKILDLHGASIYAENREDWVVFIIEIEGDVK